MKRIIINFLSYFDRQDLIKGFFNSILRALTLGSKFLLVIYLAKRFSPDDMGNYGLFTASVNYSLYLIGVDFYTYANREMMGKTKSEWPLIIRDQAIFYGISYIVAFPLLLLIFITNLMNWKFFGWFYLVLTFEHLAQESHRLLVAIQKPLHAGLVSFVRAGAWTYAIIFLMIKSPGARTLSTVWAGWASGIFLSLAIACFMLRKLDWSSVRYTSPDWTWIKTGIKKSVPFFISTLALRGIYTLDRYFLKFFWGESAVGIYSFYSGLANIVQYIIDAAVVVNYYPKLVSSYRLGNIYEYRKNLKQMALAIVFSIIVITGTSGIFIWPLLNYVGKTVYSENIIVFWLLLSVNGVITLGYIPHYGLYAMGLDKYIVTGTLISFFVCMVLYSLMTPTWGAVGVGMSLLVSSFFILIYKSYKYKSFWFSKI